MASFQQSLFLVRRTKTPLSQLFRSLSLASSSPPTTTSSSTHSIPGSSEGSCDLHNQWTPGTRRTGVLARKSGMTSFWNGDGTRVPVTVLKLEDVQVIGHKYESRDSYYAVQVGCSDRSTRNLNQSQRRWFEHAGVTPKHRVVEFKVSDERALVPVGTQISSAHFVPGQFVDVKANSQVVLPSPPPREFQTLGERLADFRITFYNKIGKDPGRVWPGKKMAGRMGNQPITVRNLLVARIDTSLNVIYVKGQVPGPTKGYVRISDAEKGVHRVAQHWIRKGWTGKKDESENGNWVLPGRIKSLPFPTIDRQAAAEFLPDQISFVGESKLK